jgi:hypothetical protein
MLADWVLSWPILFPILGALLMTPIARRIPARIRPWLSIIFLAIEIILMAVNAAPGRHRLIISDWAAASFSIWLQMDGVTWLLLLTMFVPLVALWLIAAPRKPFDPLAILVLTSAILLTCAGNLVTAYIAWTLLDVSMFFWRLGRNIERDTVLRGIAIGQATGLILFAGAILIASKQPNEGAILVAIAFWARLGQFPFHFLLPTHGADTSDLWFARGIPLIAASNLWLHWSIVGVPAPSALIGTLATLAIIASVIWIWRASTPTSSPSQIQSDLSDASMELPTRAAGVAIMPAFAVVPMMIAFGGGAAVAMGLWLTLAAVIALALFEIAKRWRADNLNRWNRLIWFAALVSLAGLPLTPAFLGRMGVYVALWESNNGSIMLLIGAAMLLILAPMWNIGFALKGGELREPTRVEYSGLVIIALAAAALSLLPMLITRALASAVGESYERSIDLVIRTNDVAGVGLGIVTLFAPVMGSYFLSTWLHNFRPRPGALILRTARFIDLDWGERMVSAIGLQMSAAARVGAAIAEENPIVWI